MSLGTWGEVFCWGGVPAMNRGGNGIRMSLGVNEIFGQKS